jgi:hypothetical protein
MIDILTTSTTRAAHKKYIQLYQGSTSDVFWPFARNLVFAEEVAAKLDVETAAYGVGTLSRMFARSVDQFGEAVAELLRISDGGSLIVSIIRHLEQSVVFQSVIDVVSEQHPEFIFFAWYLFRALVGPNYAIERRRYPRKVFLAPEVDFSSVVVTPLFLRNAIDILQAFVLLQFTQHGQPPRENFRARTADFRNLISEWIASLEWPRLTPQVIELAKALEPNEVLKTRIVDRVRDAKDLSLEGTPGELFGASVGYLAVCAGLLKWWEVAGVFAKLIGARRLCQTAALACASIVKAFCAFGKDELFARAVKQVVTEVWNRTVCGRRNYLIGAICVDAIAALDAGDDIFDGAFIELWRKKCDRPQHWEDHAEIWERPLPGLANPEFIARLVQIVEVSEVPIAEVPQSSKVEPAVPNVDGPQSSEVEPAVPNVDGPQSSEVEPPIPNTEESILKELEADDGDS